jgi:Luciferase-like monooxygenase
VAGIGLGEDGCKEFSSFGEVVDPRERGLLLDESLEILQGLLRGQPLRHRGARYAVDSGAFLPTPVQDPVPKWAACSWPNRKPLARAARLQGCFPIFAGSGQQPLPPPADDLIALRGELRRLGAPDGHDLVIRCALHRLDPADRLPPWRRSPTAPSLGCLRDSVPARQPSRSRPSSAAVRRPVQADQPAERLCLWSAHGCGARLWLAADSRVAPGPLRMASRARPVATTAAVPQPGLGVGGR